MDNIPVDGWGSKVTPICKEGTVEIIRLEREETPMDKKR